MATQTWLGDTPGDMTWLTGQHGAPADMACAILYGNEDLPTRIEAWREYNPHHETPPDWLWVASE